MKIGIQDDIQRVRGLILSLILLSELRLLYNEILFLNSIFMGEMMGVSPPAKEARKPLVEKNPSMAFDSRGEHVKKGDWILTRSTDDVTRLIAVSGISDVSNDAPALKVFSSSENISHKPGIVHIQMSRSCSYDIDKLCKYDAEYWKKLDASLLTQSVEYYPRPEQWYDIQYPVFTTKGQPPRNVGQSPFPLGFITRVKKVGELYEFFIKFPGVKKAHKQQLSVGQITSIEGMDDTTVISLVQGRDDHRYLDVSTMLLDSESQQKNVQVREVPRLGSEGAVVDKLKIDFPWLSLSDIYPPNHRISEISLDSLTEIDTKRLARLYGDKTLSKIAQKSLNPFEKSYLVARNYLHLVEFARFAETGAKDGGMLKVMPTSEKMALVDGFLAKVEEEKKKLLALRIIEEHRLVGYDVSASAVDYSLRRASQATIAPDSYLGLHSNGAITFLVDKNEEFYNTGNIYAKFAEVSLHEEGHFLGKDARGKNPNWHYEELWTEWYASVFPHTLRGDEPEADMAYHHSVEKIKGTYYSSKEKHGAFELQKAYEELMDIVDTQDIPWGNRTLRHDDIELSAMATFIKRTDRGKIKLGNGKETIGFADLYDLVMKRKSGIIPRSLEKYIPSPFAERFKNCTDKMYDKVKHTSATLEMDNADLSDSDSDQTEKQILQQLYEALYEQKIVKEYTE